MQNKPIIGLAGGIGAGKSEVAKILADLGCVVADSDAAARAALDDPEIRGRIVAEFGESVLRGRGSPALRAGKHGSGSGGTVADHGSESRGTEIDRSALAHIVFTDAAKRRTLESIIHPWVEQRRLEQFAKAPPDAPAFVIDAPLLFEAGLDRICDAVIFVDAPRKTRLHRVAQSRGWDEAELDRREASQLPLDEKRQRADHVIINVGSARDLAEQTSRILTIIVRARRTR